MKNSDRYTKELEQVYLGERKANRMHIHAWQLAEKILNGMANASATAGSLEDLKNQIDKYDR